jgi:Tyrosine phosphatase family
MIVNFAQINKNIFRGGEPSINDVIFLQKHFKINRIVSLDLIAGQRIDRTTRLLDMEHIMAPINPNKKTTMIKFLEKDITELLDNEHKTFIHCKFGKDRTGLAIALYRVEHDDWSCEDAIKEAKTFGFGIGIPPKITALFERIIKDACSCEKKDKNSAYDIVSNEREEGGSFDTSVSGINPQQSWAPYDYFSNQQYKDYIGGYETRNDFGLKDNENPTDIDVPQVGQLDQNETGINGTGYSSVGNGFI